MISVITVCYNGAKTIRKTFDQMLSQNYKDYEYIVIDGNSTDGTLDIIKEYYPKFQGKMIYVSEPDNGIYDAMNKGIKKSHGDIIGIVNCDDWYEDNTLEMVEKVYNGEKYAVIYGMMRTFINQNESSVVFYHHNFLPMQMINHPTCFITRKTYEDFGLYDSENYKSSADYELMLRYFNRKEIKFIPVYKILSNFSVGGISSSIIGEYETAKLKYSLGLIDRKVYVKKYLKAKLRKLIRS